MVQLLLASTPSIRHLLQLVSEVDESADATNLLYLKQQLPPYLSSEAKVPYDLIKACYLALRTTTYHSFTSFQKLIEGSRIVFQENKKPEKSPELQRILAEAQKIVDAQSYFEMTGKTFASHAPVPSMSSTMTDSQFVICVVNVFVSAVSVFVAVLWIASEYDIGMHVFIALFAGMLVLGAEAFLIYRNS